MAAHSAALGRLEAVASKRAEAIAAQDELVARAEAQVSIAATSVVEVSGFERASVILGVPKGSLRRQLSASRQSQRVTP